jgi:hypothetical protein
VIKRLRFVRRHPGVTAEEFAREWPRTLASTRRGPEAVRPSVLTLGLAVPEIACSELLFDAVELAGFEDARHLARFERSGPARSPADALEAPDPVLIVAEEHVLRGADWLRAHRDDGPPAYLHLALARRAEGLTPAEFARRWREHAGTVGGHGTAPATPIPADVRGQAYVQNHPCPRPDGEWPYDAVNEVYLADEEALRARASWFAATLPRTSGDALFARSSFLTLREIPPTS